MDSVEKEKLEVLNGDRGDKSRAAVRLLAIQQLVNAIPAEPTGDAAADMKALYAGINALRIAVQQ